MEFEWDLLKEIKNIAKHGVSFRTAEAAFRDSHRIIREDLEHSKDEKRFFCIGHDGRGILTVRYTWRDDKIRVICAGYWRKTAKIYENKNPLHKC